MGIEKKSDDLYGSMLRLNPNEDTKSYGKRRFYIRYAPADNSTLKDACEAVTDSDHPLVANIPVQEVTAKKVGPDSFFVEAEYYRPAVNTGQQNVIQMSTVAMQQRVFRLPYTVAADGAQTIALDGTSKLPDGDWVGFPKSTLVYEANNKIVVPTGSQEVASTFWTTPVSTVTLKGRITSTQWIALFASNGALRSIGRWNSNQFTVAGVTFAAETLRFDGITNSVTTGLGDGGDTVEYNIGYRFSWKPDGWFTQRLKSSGTIPGSLDTENVSDVGETVEYTTALFPVS